MLHGRTAVSNSEAAWRSRHELSLCVPCRRSGCSLIFGGGILRAGARAQFASARSRDLHFDLAKRVHVVRLFRREPQRVLLAQIPGDLRRDARNRTRAIREIGNAASIFGEMAQHPRVHFPVVTDQPDGINHHLRFLRQRQDLREFLHTGIVSAVADDDQRLPLVMPELQMQQPFGHRVIKRGSSACAHGKDSFGSSLGSSVNAFPFSSSTETSSLKSTTNISSWGLPERAKEETASPTSSSCGPMLRLWSTISPTVMGASPCWNMAILCRRPSSYTRKFCSLSPSTALPLASVTLTGSTTSSVCTEIADEAGGGGLDCAKPASAEHSSAAVKPPQRQIPLHVCDRMIRITGEAPRAAGYEPSFRPAAHRSLLRL